MSVLHRPLTYATPIVVELRGGAGETRNVLDKVPDSARDEVKAMVQASYYAPNQEVARMVAAQVLDTYQDRYPAAMRSFQAA